MLLHPFRNQFLETTLTGPDNHHPNLEHLEKGIKLCNTIIRSRNNNDENKKIAIPTPITKKKTLDLLPKHSINAIASNLKQKDYALLSRANRTVSIACNDPNSLQDLDFSFLRFAPSLQPLNLEKYSQIKHLSIPLEKSPISMINKEILHDEYNGYLS